MANQTAAKTAPKQPHGIAEIWRKFLVALKRKPSMIPMAMLIIAFLEYSLNLMHMSDTTALIQGTGMGLCGFITMLLSILSFLVFMNTFPNRKPTNKIMLCLLIVMIGITIGADLIYANGIYTALTREVNTIVVDAKNYYIAQAYNEVYTHVYLQIATIVLTLLLPVYSKFIKKIKTSIEVEGNGDMATIDISGED